MTIKKLKLPIAFIFILLVITESNVYADAVLGPFETNEKWLVLGPIIIWIVALFAWFIIRSIRKKKDADNL